MLSGPTYKNNNLMAQLPYHPQIFFYSQTIYSDYPEVLMALSLNTYRIRPHLSNSSHHLF